MLSVHTAAGVEREGRPVLTLERTEQGAAIDLIATGLDLDAADCAHLRDLFGEMATRLRGEADADLREGLTDREFEVLGLVAAGHANKEVARRLSLSIRTVETHRLNLRRKTRTGRLHEMVALARRVGARVS